MQQTPLGFRPCHSARATRRVSRVTRCTAPDRAVNICPDSSTVMANAALASGGSAAARGSCTGTVDCTANVALTMKKITTRNTTSMSGVRGTAPAALNELR